MLTRVAELVALRLDDVDLDANRVRVNLGKGGKDRLVPFPATFAETLALHMDAMRRRGAVHLFESSWKKPYSTRGVRAMRSRYAAAAGLTHPISPHQLRHFLFTWLKTQGIDDALIQPYSKFPRSWRSRLRREVAALGGGGRRRHTAVEGAALPRPYDCGDGREGALTSPDRAAALAVDVHRQQAPWRARPVKRVHILKANGRQRATVEDSTLEARPGGGC
jgi:hypothetical protein